MARQGRLVTALPPPDSRRVIPVSIVTGFLGAGKTTLIARILRDPAFARTAVVVNEFGEIGLDHELIATSDETLLTLTTGCLCCAVRSDLVETLLDLHARREAGTAAYDRVLIETSGLADPAPILQALMADPGVTATHTLDTLVTVVDAVLGAATLDAHPEARRQVALADLLVVSKTDLAAAPGTPVMAGLVPAISGEDGTVAATHPRDGRDKPGHDTATSLPLPTHLSALNPGAAIIAAPDLTPSHLFLAADPAARTARLAAVPDQPAGSPFSQARHTGGIESFVLQRDEPVPALALAMLLQALAEHCGPRLLRLKGLVGIREMSGLPAVIHGVQHVFSPPVFLDRWPSDDHSTRLVFIGSGIPRHFPARLLTAIEAEVAEALEQHR